MLKFQITIIAFLFFSSFVIGQNIIHGIEWQKCFGSTGSEEPTSTIQTSDGGYAFVSPVNSYNDGDLSGIINHGSFEIWVVKMSASRTIEWQKLIGGTGGDFPCSIIQTSDGGYMVLSYTNSTNGDNTCLRTNYDNIWMIKLSSQGTIQWQKCYGGSSYELASVLIQTSDGGFVILGTTQSNDGDVSGNHSTTNSGNIDGWVVKVSSSGTIQWQKCLGGIWDERLRSIKQTSDGGFILAGYTASNDGDVSGNHGGGDAWVVKLSSTGALQWQRCLGGSGYDWGTSIIQSADGGYLFTGLSQSKDGDVTGHHKSYIDDTDAWVVKLSATGNILWQKSLGGFLKDVAYDAIQTFDGGYLIAAYTESQDGDVSQNLGQRDAWLLKLSPNGVLLWEKTFGGTGYDEFLAITKTTNGGYLISGTTTSNDNDVNGNHGNKDIWLVKITSDFKSIIGRVQQTTTSCQPLTSPQYFSNGQVKIDKNNSTYYVSTGSTGRFGVFADTGRYTISAITPNQLWTACPPQTINIIDPTIRDTTIVNPNIYINSLCPINGS